MVRAFPISCALAVWLCSVACAPPPQDLTEEQANLLGGTVLVPSRDVDRGNVTVDGSSTALYTNIDDGSSFAAADDGRTDLRNHWGVARSTYITGLAAGPSGTVTTAAISYRARADWNVSGSLQMNLFAGGRLAASGPVRPLPNAWTNLTDTFNGLAIPNASDLAVQVVLNTGTSGYLRVTQIWAEVVTGPGAGAASPDAGMGEADAGTGPVDAGSPCLRTTCGALGKTCGNVADGCGGTLSCGTCGSGQTCENNVCGAAGGPTIPGTACPAFPADNIWNTDISSMPIHSRSSAWIGSVSRATLDFNFGPYADWGMPYNVVTNATPLVTPRWTCCGSESDPGPYPLTSNTVVETGGGGDGHALMVNRDTCTLYELYAANWNKGSPYAGQGSIWSLTSNALRREGWTSADDAGLPITSGLLRYEEVAAGEVKHAIRFTLQRINSAYHLWPARFTPSYLGTPDLALAPMGSRFRMKAGFDISRYSRDAQVILNGLKRYGMFLADVGNDWTVVGTSDPRWSAALGSEIQKVPISAFEAVDESSLMVDPNSGAARQSSSTCTPTTCAAQGKNCGTVSNGCGGTLSCGTCASGQTCGGGGAANVCGTSNTGADDPILVGAGDIAGDNGDQERTALLLDGLFANGANNNGVVFLAGDNAYADGSLAQYNSWFAPTWGRHKARIKPAPGNHEYDTDATASGYYAYFGAAAGDPTKGYYSYNLGAWHVVVLNSEINVAKGSPQEQWLRADLAAHPAGCTAAYFHRPRFSSGLHGNQSDLQPLWQALYELNADVVVSGHDHTYERFAPQTPAGAADTSRGIREFVVGTGGWGLYALGSAQPNSQVRYNGGYGVLKLTLHAGSYDWQFLSEAGKSFTDQGTSLCH
jgi:hypothetical protein